MIVHTDSIQYAQRALADDLQRFPYSPEHADAGLDTLASAIYSPAGISQTVTVTHDFWRLLFIVERASVSHYDIIVDLCQRNIDLPDRLLCLAGSGDRLHGQRNRPWLALPGNIHLTAHLTPQRSARMIGTGFSVLAAISVIDAIDRIEGLAGRAGIKWVNDIVIDEAKVSGFITHTVIFEDVIGSAIIGIGLNVETTPPISPDRFFYRAAALRDFLPDTTSCAMNTALSPLLDSLASNYDLLLAGGFSLLLNRYRDRSVIIGREVEILPDSPGRSDKAPIRGVVTDIGDNLELILKGRKEPVNRGRLALL